MGKIIIAFVLIIVSLTSCKTENAKQEPLVKLTKTELIKKVKENKLFNLESIIYKDSFGKIISADSFNKLSKQAEWTADRYVNRKGQIKELRLRTATEGDIRFEIGLQEIYERNQPLELIEIDCNNIPDILENVFTFDQEMRKNGNKIDSTIDRENITTIVSIIENCGMPSLQNVSQKQMNTIWLVFQHTENTIRKKYFPLIKKSAENGDLAKNKVAMMQDRILMLDGQSQIY